MDALQQQLLALKTRVTSYAGLTFSANRAKSMEYALEAMSKKRGELPMPRLFEQLDQNTELLHELTEHLLIHETYFCREKDSIEYCLSRLSDSAKHSQDEFRIWSAGCSTGEEAYTLAILLSDMSLKRRFKILATDLSERALNVARRGCYSKWSLRGVPLDWTAKHFEPIEQSFRLKNAELKERITFLRANLTADRLPPEWKQLELIVCRNVLIYFDRPTIRRIATMFFELLTDGGCLLTGASDPPLGEFADFEVESSPFGLIYRRRLQKLNALAENGIEGTVATFIQSPDRIEVSPSQERVTSGIRALSDRSTPVFPRGNFKPGADENRDAKRDCVSVGQHPDVVEKAQASYLLGEWEAVVSLLSPVASPIPATGLALLVKSLLNMMRAEEAIRVTTQAIDENGGNAGAFVLLALALMSRGDYVAAAEKANMAIFLDRSLVYAHYLLGTAYVCQKQPQQAAKALRNAQSWLNRLPADEPILFAEEQTREQLAGNIDRFISLVGCKL